MRALTVQAGVGGTVAWSDIDEPDPDEGDVLVATHRVGLCGTDREIAAGEYGQAPRGSGEGTGHGQLVIGHEAIGRVLEAPGGAMVSPGDLVVPVVRHPDPVPCTPCSAGEWDMCGNGLFTEHGIVGRHGFARERFRASPGMLVRVPESLGDLGVLVEPATVAAKAWEQIEWISRRSCSSPRRALVTGTGPIGLLVTLVAVQRSYEVHVLGRATGGPKPDLVAALGAQYHTGDAADLDGTIDVAVECTGAPSVIEDVLGAVARNGIVCLTGLSAPAPTGLDLGTLARGMVLRNLVVFGSVNANRRHFDAASAALAAADPSWLARLITTRVPAHRNVPGSGSAATVLERGAHDIKTVLEF